MASNITTIQNPDFAATLSRLRDLSISPAEVRATVSKLTTILAKESLKAPPKSDEKIAIVIVLRSGLAMMEPFVSELPPNTDMVIHHLGIYRDRMSLQPVEYYNKLTPRASNIRHAYVLDPLIATGGTAAAVINTLRDWGIEKITFNAILGSKQGVEDVANLWPSGTEFVVGSIDGDLDSKGYVRPGVGDIGDRLFGTK